MGNRDEALLKGEKFYNSGLPCRRGHQADRYTSSGNCVECGALSASLMKAKRDFGIQTKRGNPLLFATTLPEPAHLVFRGLRDLIVSARPDQQGEILDCLMGILEGFKSERCA